MYTKQPSLNENQFKNASEVNKRSMLNNYYSSKYGDSISNAHKNSIMNKALALWKEWEAGQILPKCATGYHWTGEECHLNQTTCKDKYNSGIAQCEACRWFENMTTAYSLTHSSERNSGTYCKSTWLG